jgi:Co/Zn/Cd efflux system component
MDVPARQASVVAVVKPEERTAAAAYTISARYAARPIAPIIAGALVQASTLAAPFVIAGTLKSIYDLAFYRMFRGVPRRGGAARRRGMSTRRRGKAQRAGCGSDPAAAGYSQRMTALRHTHTHRHGEVEHEHTHEHPPGQAHDDPAAHDHEHANDQHAAHDHAHADHHEHGDDHEHGHDHDHGEAGHGHSHGLVDRSIVRSREGIKAVAISLTVLGLAAFAQVLIFIASSSVALLADLIHNFGDALTAIPLGIAFLLRSFRGEKLAGLAVVAVIFFSACVALYESIQRILHPHALTHLWVLAAAGAIGFAGNEIAAQVRLRAGRRLHSPALIADGNHARVDGYVSLAVIASAALVGLGLQRADPLIGLAITVVILKITWDSWRVVSTTDPGEIDIPREH